MDQFEDFFRRGTATADRPGGYEPYGYQARLARDGLPAVVQAPTGVGKTGVILAWLWRRLHGPDRDGTPRRLVYALPQRSLVEQVARQAESWLENLGLSDEVPLHVVMGGAGKTQRFWRVDMHKPTIVVGTIDSLVSKALNRGYGIGRAIYPIDFALVTNGAHWIIDEIQLCPEATTTLRQLAAFAARLRTAEPFGLTCMSATVPEGLLDTVDNPAPVDDEIVRIEQAERVGELDTRLGARRTVRMLDAAPGAYAAVATAVAALHRPGSLTIVVMNTVDAARQVFKGLRAESTPVTLLHSRFRGVERRDLIDKITGEPGDQGHIVVSTQVIEAGIDLNAAVLVTEAAPWPSVVQRAGRCNRTGLVEDAQLWWLSPAKPQPYEEADVQASVAELAELDGVAASSEELLGRDVAVTQTPVMVLRRPDLVALFDTAPDLSNADIDVAPYVRDAEDMDAQVAWARWEPVAMDGRPPDDASAPPDEWRCRVPLGGISELVKKDIAVWRMDQALGRWTRVTNASRARPGEALVVAASDGGYDPVLGFDAAIRRPVADAPEMRSKADLMSGGEDAFGADSTNVAQRMWLPLDRHSEDVRAQAVDLLDVLRSSVSDDVRNAIVVAAYAHDAGKAHPIWQNALCRLAPEERADEIANGRPWAKSASSARLEFEGKVRFRHELASLLMLDGPLGALLVDAAEPDLVRYLVLAHHGKLRVQVREPTDADPDVLLGLRRKDVREIPPLLGFPPTQLEVDLDQFALGGERSWTRTAVGLRDRYGPFILAYLETVVRVADWRASAELERVSAELRRANAGQENAQ